MSAVCESVCSDKKLTSYNTSFVTSHKQAHCYVDDLSANETEIIINKIAMNQLEERLPSGNKPQTLPRFSRNKRIDRDEFESLVSNYFDVTLDPNVTQTESAEPPCHVIHSNDVNTRLSGTYDSHEEERRLIQASVKYIDCKDFPFDEVLSLEDSVKKVENMRHCTSKPLQLRISEQTNATANRQPVNYRESKGSKTGTKGGKKNRPPLLKGSTWPTSEFTLGMDGCKTGGLSKASDSRLDSPSFYSSSMIDFSAISHLSEEHDRIMAQENAEKAYSNLSYISQTTKNKLYGKATQRSVSMNGSFAQINRKYNKKITDDKRQSAYSVTINSTDSNMQSHAASVTPKRHSINTAVLKSNSANISKNCEDLMNRNMIKQASSPPEKDFRKRYVSSSGVTVTSTPFPPHRPGEGNTPTMISPIPSTSDSLLNGDRADSGKKQASHATVEKQPLPPEGFKISRYPLKRKIPPLPTAISLDEQNSLPDSELLLVIKKLRKQLERAEEKAAEAEKQAKEWKETAQQTLRAAHVIKARMEIEKARADYIDLSINDDNSNYDVTHTQQRLYDNEKATTTPIARLDAVHAYHEFFSSKESRLDASTRKRASSGGSNHEVKRKRISRESIILHDQHKVTDAKQNSMLEWLSNTESIDDVNYMTLLGDTSSPSSSEPISPQSGYNEFSRETNVVDTKLLRNAGAQRSIAHKDAKKALLAKVDACKPGQGKATEVELTSQLTLKPQDTFDNLLDTLNVDVDSIISTSQDVGDIAANAFDLSGSFDQIDKVSSSSVSSPFSPNFSHSFSDSEIQSGNITRYSIDSPPNERSFLCRRISNSAENLPNRTAFKSGTVAEVANDLNFDFLSQLGCILDL